MRDIESNTVGGAVDIPVQRRLELLIEWREALIDIVAADPAAVETRKRIDSINDEIAAIRCASVLPELD